MRSWQVSPPLSDRRKQRVAPTSYEVDGESVEDGADRDSKSGGEAAS